MVIKSIYKRNQLHINSILNEKRNQLHINCILNENTENMHIWKQTENWRKTIVESYANMIST